MLRDPHLRLRDGRVGGRPRARQARERLLAGLVPVDQEHARGLHRAFDPGHARDQVERKVVPAGAAAAHHQPLVGAGRDDDALRVHAHVGVARGERVAIRPVRGRVVAIEQPGFGEQHGTGAGRGDHAAACVAVAQPAGFFFVAVQGDVAGIDRQVGDADVVGRGQVAQSDLGGDDDVVDDVQWRGVACHDQRMKGRFARRQADHRRPVAAGRVEQVVHAVQHRGGGAVGGEQGDGGAFTARHDGNVRLAAEMAAVSRCGGPYRAASPVVDQSGYRHANAP